MARFRAMSRCMDSRAATEILRQTTEAGPTRSVSPTDIARALATEWHAQLSAVRRAAIRLAEAGRIDILRKGKPVPPATVKGVIRLRLRPGPESDPSAGPVMDPGVDPGVDPGAETT